MPFTMLNFFSCFSILLRSSGMKKGKSFPKWVEERMGNE